ncbi:MAG: transcriptional regulator [Bryobacteraceae bacterium]|nr:transcriptional regulator [Solibacteraceae bacterium]MCO5350988.1 transcriptional regulator [Bryobacteraceae bacterium]
MAKSAARRVTEKPASPRETLRVVSSPVADHLIHERVRLAIVSSLAVNPSLTFNELKRLLDITDGNLSIHARKLEEAGYIQCEKAFEGRMPKTTFRLSQQGRTALGRYLDHMERLIEAARG